MTGIGVSPATYSVAVDHGSVERRNAAERGTRYFVSLRGSIDERWAAAFRNLRIREPRTSGFALDRYGRTVSFTCAIDDPRAVIATLGALDSLVKLINDTAAALDFS